MNFLKLTVLALALSCVAFNASSETLDSSSDLPITNIQVNQDGSKTVNQTLNGVESTHLVSVNAKQVAVALSFKNKNGVVNTQSRLVTLDGLPITSQVGETIPYTKAVGVKKNENGEDIVTMTPGKITTGFSYELTPMILKDGKILLNYSITNELLLSLENVNMDNALTVQKANTQLAHQEGKIIIESNKPYTLKLDKDTVVEISVSAV